MREYYITFNPLDPTLSPIGPFVINAELKEDAMDIAAGRFKNEHPDSSANLRDYRPSTVSWTRSHK